MKILFSRIMLGSFAFLSPLALHAESRDWTNREGKVIQAELVKYDSVAKKVTLKLSNGNEAIRAIDTLSDSDQAWLTDLQRKLDKTAATIQATEVKVTVGDISRWYGSADGGIRLAVKYSGPELAEAKGVRTTVKTATDGAGNELKQKESRFDNDDGKFRELKKPFGFGSGKGENADHFEVELSFVVPEEVKSIKTLAGSLELVLSARDPGSIVTASFAKDAGKPLKSGTLTAAGVEITLLKPSGEPTGSGEVNGVAFQEYGLSYQVSDPQNKIASVEFLDASGTKLKSTGFGSSEVEGTKKVSVSFQVMPPPDAVAKIYLVTDRAVVTVPFDLKDIPLP